MELVKIAGLLAAAYVLLMGIAVSDRKKRDGEG